MTEQQQKQLAEIREKLEKEMFPLIPKKTEELLIKIVQKRKPKMILELGSGKGYSGSVMLLNSDAGLVTIEKEKANYDEALKNYMELEFYGRVLPVNAPAEDVVKSIANAKEKQLFDLIFLDCAKSTYVRVLEDLIGLLSPGGVLVADDCLYFGKIYDGKEIPDKKHRTIVVNLRKFITAVEEDKRFETVTMYEIDNGVLVATLKDKKEEK